MKKILILAGLFILVCGAITSQTPYDTVNVYDPQNFTEWTAAIDTASVQAISRKAGLNRRINYNTLKKYFAPDVLLGWIGSDLDTTGISATYYNQFVTDSQGDVWFVDMETGQGKRVLDYQQGKIDSLSFYGDTLRLYEGDSPTPFKAKISSATGTAGLDLDIMDGLARHKPDMTIVDDSGLKLDIEAIGGGDMIFQIDGAEGTLDCTTGSGSGGKARVSLTAGADANNPATNYIYVTISGATCTLNASTSLPTGAFAWVGKIVVPDATTWATTGAYVFQRYTESKNDSRGQISHGREKLRALGAVWISGGVPSTTIGTNGAAADTVHLATTAATVYQLHRQSFPAFTTGPYYYGNGTNQYDQITDLASALNLADGTAISAQRFNLVIWGAVNVSSGECKLFVNLPNAVYNNDEQAKADINNTADYSIPSDFKSVGFMIARIALRHTTQDGGTWEELATYDLRGTPPGVRTGGATVTASTDFSDSEFRIFDNGNETKQIAFEASGIATATTRTIIMPDNDVSLDTLNSQTLSVSNDSLTISSSGNTVKLGINELATEALANDSITFDLESRYQKLFETDMTSAEASVTVLLSNPFTAGVYTFSFTDIAGTQELIWPSNVKGLDEVSLGTVTYSGPFIKTCYYNGTNYICPPDYEPNIDFAADSITTTTLTVDLEYDYQKVVEIDMTSCTSVTLTVNNPVAGGVYTFHYWGVSGTDNVTWPAAFEDANGTALGTDALTAGTFYTCYYNPDRAKYYCK